VSFGSEIRLNDSRQIVKRISEPRHWSILFLAPKSAGATSRQTYSIPLRQASGMANVSRECNDL